MIYMVKLWPAGGLTNEQVESVLAQEVNWVRFEYLTWFVHSKRTADELHSRLEHFVGSGKSIVVKVDLNSIQGLQPKMVWDWVNARKWPNLIGG